MPKVKDPLENIDDLSINELLTRLDLLTYSFDGRRNMEQLRYKINERLNKVDKALQDFGTTNDIERAKDVLK